MARKQSGAFSKLLNFIGLVDDEETRDTYGEEYSGDNYGRQAAYTPSRPQRGAATGRAASRQAFQRRLSESAPSRGRTEGRSARTSASSRGYDDYRVGERRGAGSRFEDSGYDYLSRQERASASRYDDPPARYSGASRFPAPAGNRYGANLPQRAPQMRPRVSARSRTVMYSLHSLEDCCEVIDQLIANNTVVLTMDELDGHLLQRAVDTLSGAVFALHASIRKASDRTYLVAPMSVEINDTYDLDRRF